MEDSIILKTLVENKKDREFYSLCLNDGLKINDIVDFHDKFKTFKNLFSQNKIKPSNFLDGKRPKEAFTALTNTCDKLIIKSKANKKMRSFFSNKHKEIVNDETFDLFCELIELNVADEFYQGFRKKVSAFKTAEALNDSLMNELSTIKEWNNPEGLIQKIKENNVSNIKIENNEVLFEVNDFESAKALGTQMWCICRDDETFKNHQSDVDRIFFKYNMNEFVNNINSMTAYIVNADGSVNTGYYKDDEAMKDDELKSQNVSFDAYSFEEFKDRFQSHGHSNGLLSLQSYTHNMSHEIKEREEIEQANTEDFLKFLSKSPSHDVLEQVLDDKKLLFKNKSGASGILINHLERSFSRKSKTLLFKVLNDKDYQDSQAFKELKFIDVVNNHSYLDKDDYQRVFDVKSFELKQEIIDCIKKDKTYLFNSEILKISKEQNIDVFDDFKNDPKKIVKLINHNLNLIDDLFGGEKDTERVLTLIKPYVENEHSTLILSLKEFAEDRNLRLFDNDSIKNSIIQDMVKRPNTLFVKAKKLDEMDLNLDYKSSMSIIKKLFLDDDLPFDDYEADYLMEDVVEANMNVKTKDFVLNSERFNSEARKDFFSKINESRELASEKDKINFDIYYEKFCNMESKKADINQKVKRDSKSKNKI